jgi:hypothetical protein
LNRWHPARVVALPAVNITEQRPIEQGLILPCEARPRKS